MGSGWKPSWIPGADAGSTSSRRAAKDFSRSARRRDASARPDTADDRAWLVRRDYTVCAHRRSRVSVTQLVNTALAKRMFHVGQRRVGVLPCRESIRDHPLFNAIWRMIIQRAERRCSRGGWRSPEPAAAPWNAHQGKLHEGGGVTRANRGTIEHRGIVADERPSGSG